MNRFLLPAGTLGWLLAALLAAPVAHALPSWGLEPHQHLDLPRNAGRAPEVALTLDACGGAFDAELIRTLVQHQVPATVFVTRKWIEHNPAGVASLLAHPELFDLQDHGTHHQPALMGAGRRVYGLQGVGSLPRLQEEVLGAAQAIEGLTGRKPLYFRGATAVYDEPARQAIEAMGFRVAGFTVNADAGATLPQAAIEARLRGVRDGDVIIAHMNKPAGATAEALAATLPALKARGLRFVTLSQVPLRAD